jgi:hypothetical protein
MMTIAWLANPVRVALLVVLLTIAPAGVAQPEFPDSANGEATPSSQTVSALSPQGELTDATVGNDALGTGALGIDSLIAPSKPDVDQTQQESTSVVSAATTAADSEPSIVVDPPFIAKPVSPTPESAPSKLVSTKVACPAPCVTNSRDDDDIWLVSSRGCGCQSFAAAGPPLKYWRYIRQQGWVASSGEAFFATARPEQPVVIAVHGNRMNQQSANDFGWAIYQRIVRNSPEQPPLRFVTWAWPSDKAPTRATEDVRIKCARSDVDARFVAWFIEQLPATAPLSFCGYSLGVRIVAGALEMRAGGVVNGRGQSPSIGSPRPPARAVFMASAIDNDWLLPGRRYGRALGQLEHLLLFNNSSDRALRFYHRIYSKHGGPEALGYTGLAGPGLLGASLAKIEQRDVACVIGPRHDWELYVANLGSSISKGLTFPLASAVGVAQNSSRPTAIAAGESSIASNRSEATTTPTQKVADDSQR